MVLLFALITGMSIWEYTGLINEVEDVQINRFINTVAGVYFFFAVAGVCMGIVGNAVFIPYLLTIVYILLSELFLKAKNPIINQAYSALGQMYIAVPLSMICVLAFNPSQDGTPIFNNTVPLSVFIFLWLNDTGAYCCGSIFGKHKLFERVSPKKTWEGTIGGVVLAVVVGAVIGAITVSDGEGDKLTSALVFAGLAMVVAVFGTLGDLVESLFKRTIGVKDSGNILPGHGGMLDRFDSSLLAIPAAVIYFYTLSVL